METFPSSYYNDRYFEGMAPGNFRHFVESGGRSLLPNRLRDLALVDVRPGMRVLDVGCGRGELVMYCGSRGADAYGIDYSESAVTLATQCMRFYTPEESSRIHIFQGDATALPFEDKTFDRIMSWATVEHLYQPQVDACLSEMRRVLKDDGVLVIGTHPNGWYEQAGYRLVRPVKQLFTRRRLCSVEELREIEPEHVNVKNPLSLWLDLKRHRFAGRVRLRSRNEFELNYGMLRLLGRAMESIPLVRALFCTEITAFGAKSRAALAQFLKGRNQSGRIGEQSIFDGIRADTISV